MRAEGGGAYGAVQGGGGSGGGTLQVARSYEGGTLLGLVDR
jgi:hypothetical protein